MLVGKLVQTVAFDHVLDVVDVAGGCGLPYGARRALVSYLGDLDAGMHDKTLSDV